MNKNKKITTTILIGLTTFSMVGCNKEPKVQDIFEGNNLMLEDNTDLNEIAIENDVAVDSEGETTVVNGEYSEEQIKADFKIVEDLASEVTAASFNDAFFAVFASDGTKVNDGDFYMDKEIANGEKNAENIKIPQIKKIADIYINTYKSQSDLIKKLSAGEIEEANFEGEFKKINEDFVKDVMSDLTFTVELSELIEKYGLSMSELLDLDTIQNNASTIVKDKYEQNMQDFLVKELQDFIKEITQ